MLNTRIRARKLKLFLSGGLVLASLSIPLAAAAQTDSTAEVGDAAKEKMLAAIKINGLTGSDVQPWHLKASFKVLYKQSSISDQGTFEELWASPSKYRRAYTSAVVSQTEYGSENLPLVAGSRDPIPSPLSRLRVLILGPMPNERTIASRGVSTVQQEIDGAEQPCIAVNPIHMGEILIPGTAYCLDADGVLLRSAEDAPRVSQVTFKNPIDFQGHKLARDIEWSDAGTVLLSIHIDSLEPLTQIDDAAFQAPPDATPLRVKIVATRSAPGVAGRITGIVPQGELAISAGVAQGLLIDKVAPVYPEVARAAKVSGTVILEATISKEGKVTDLRVVGGPPLLQQAALDAVEQWTYRPYMLNGQPAEVRTTVNVLFQLSPAIKPQ
jgi:TonB family protein